MPEILRLAATITYPYTQNIMVRVGAMMQQILLTISILLLVLANDADASQYSAPGLCEVDYIPLDNNSVPTI